MYAPVNPFVAISHLIFSGIASIVLAIETIPFREYFSGISILTSRMTDNLYVTASGCNASASFLIAWPFRRLRKIRHRLHQGIRTLSLINGLIGNCDPGLATFREC